MSVPSNHWFNLICMQDRMEMVEDAIEYFENELEQAKEDAKISGSIEQAASRLPGIFEFRYRQFQEVEGILNHLNIFLRKARAECTRNFVEKYNRDMTVREAEKFIDGEDDVVTWSTIVNSFALIRNQYSGLLKGLDHKNWQISNIVKLRVAGLDDAKLD